RKQLLKFQALRPRQNALISRPVLRKRAPAAQPVRQMPDRQSVSLGGVVFHDDAEVRQHQKAGALYAGGHQQKRMVVRSWERMTVRAPDAVTFPLADRYRPPLVGEKEIECRRHHDLVAPRLTSDPSIFFQIVCSGCDEVRHRVDDVATPVTVKVDGIAFERGRHELCRTECASPRADQMLRPDVTTLKNFESRQKFFAEKTLSPANTGQRRSGAQNRSLAAKRSIVRFDAPDRRDRIAVNAVGPLYCVKNAAVFFDQRSAPLDAFVGHENIKIVPDRFGELGLVVEQGHDAHLGRYCRCVLCKVAPRNAALRRRRPEPLDATMKIGRRRPDGLSRHEWMAGCAGLSAPFRHQLRSRLWQRSRGGGVTAVAGILRAGNSAGSRKNASNDNQWQ